MRVCVCLHMCVCVCVGVCECVWMCLFVCLYRCVYAYVCVAVKWQRRLRCSLITSGLSTQSFKFSPQLYFVPRYRKCLAHQMCWIDLQIFPDLQLCIDRQQCQGKTIANFYLRIFQTLIDFFCLLFCALNDDYSVKKRSFTVEIFHLKKVEKFVTVFAALIGGLTF